MLWIRSLLFTIFFYSGFALILIVCFPALFIGKKACRWVFKILGYSMLLWCRIFLNLTYEIKGKEKIPKEQAIYACKHQSVWEAGALLAKLPNHYSILKKELMSIPLYGLYLKRSKSIGVDRKNGIKALPMMANEAKKIYDEGGQLFFFPEGTRSKAGERGEYKRGIVFLYEKLNVPIVPIALNSGVFWPRREFIKKPGHITLQYLDPIPPGLDRKELMKRLENSIEEASMDLYEEATKGDLNA